MVIGFALEDGDLVKRGFEKLVRKGVDLLIANSVDVLGKEAGEFILFDGREHHSLRMTKAILSQHVLDSVVKGF